MRHVTACIVNYCGALGSFAAVAVCALYTGKSGAQSAKESQPQAPTVANSSEASPIYGVKIPPGYRNWKLIAVKSLKVGEKADQLRAQLGNDIAVKAYREGKLPFPDGTIIAALHNTHSPSAENNRIFGRPQSFVPGNPTNIQFMVKDSVKYAATGGWGFGHFQDGKPGAEAFMKTCFPCHAQEKARDLVFTHYAP